MKTQNTHWIAGVQKFRERSTGQKDPQLTAIFCLLQLICEKMADTPADKERLGYLWAMFHQQDTT